MSVFQRGGSYLQRHLTKLYSDTKQSYETATVASKTHVDENPNLEALRHEFRIQKDRLLAWGLQWSDSTAIATSTDVEIDQKLDQAGLGHVVALVMSDIQKLLVESETIQNPGNIAHDKKSPSQISSKESEKAVVDADTDEVAKSQSLLQQLTTCIDSLYKLSESRRTHNSSSQAEKSPQIDTTDGKHLVENPSCAQAADRSPVALVSSEHGNLIPQALKQNRLFVDPSVIVHTNDGNFDPELPPPYEEIAHQEKTRRPGKLRVASLSDEQRVHFGCEGLEHYPVLVEYSPIDLSSCKCLAAQGYLALQASHQIIEKQHLLPISHNGVLQLVAYTVDVAHLRQGFIFRLPSQNPRETFDYRIPRIISLRSLIPPKRESSESVSPSLEDRFRLGYNLLLSLLQLWSQDCHHLNLRSANVMLLSNDSGVSGPAVSVGCAGIDVRRPYRIQHPFPAGCERLDNSPFSVDPYRHADDSYHDVASRPWPFQLYILGLTLLEIGLWVPLGRFWKTKYSRADFTSKIKSVYIPKLASKCGAVYVKVVQTLIDAPSVFSVGKSSTQALQQASSWHPLVLQTGLLLARCCAIDLGGSSCERDMDYLRRMDHRLHGTAQVSLSDQSLGRCGPSNDATACVSARPQIVEQPAQETRSSSFQPRPTSQANASGQPALKRWKNIEIPQEDLDQWNMNLMPKISKLLRKALDSSPESCSVSVVMAGKTPDTARKTIYVQCTSVDKVREYLNQSFRCKKGWRLVVVRGVVARSGRTRKKKDHQVSGVAAPFQPPFASCQSSEAMNEAYQERPTSGASIGAYRHGEHLPPVSFGGTILIDGKPYGMTVHHMLDPPSDDEDGLSEEDAGSDGSSRQSAARRPPETWLKQLAAGRLAPCDDRPPGGAFQTRDILAEDADNDSDDECSTIASECVEFDDGDDEFWFTDSARQGGDVPGLDEDSGSDLDFAESSILEESDNEDERVSVGDVAGVDPLDDEEIYVTQPAIDDVENDFFPCEEDKDDEHLASHRLGYVHASSGIRRVVTGPVKHEVDWALIRVQDDRLSIENRLSKETGKPVRDRFMQKGQPQASCMPEELAGVTNNSVHSTTRLTSIAPSTTLARLPVQCHGRTSGLQSGRIAPALALIKLRGRTSFSSSWVVEGGAFGIPGDSGAWVFDPQSGAVCGHVLAWGNQSRTAYMAPMDILLYDIKRKLGAEHITLPAVESDPVEPRSDMPPARQRMMASENAIICADPSHGNNVQKKTVPTASDSYNDSANSFDSSSRSISPASVQASRFKPIPSPSSAGKPLPQSSASTAAREDNADHIRRPKKFSSPPKTQNRFSQPEIPRSASFTYRVQHQVPQTSVQVPVPLTISALPLRDRHRPPQQSLPT